MLTLEEIDHLEKNLMASGKWTESLVKDVCAAAREHRALVDEVASYDAERTKTRAILETYRAGNEALRATIAERDAQNKQLREAIPEHVSNLGKEREHTLELETQLSERDAEIERLTLVFHKNHQLSEMAKAEIDRLKDCNVELETRRNDACRAEPLIWNQPHWEPVAVGIDTATGREIERLRDTILSIRAHSSPDPFRTFDNLIKEVEMIDDLARAALSARKEGK